MHVSTMRRAMAITQNANTAWLLERIAFWQQHATVVRNGTTWIANSRKAWMVETGMTFKQVTTSLSHLRKEDLVASCQAKWKGVAVLHVQLTSKARGLLGSGCAHLGTPKYAHAGTPECAHSGSPYTIQGGQSGSSDMEKSCDAVAKVGPAEYESLGKHGNPEEDQIVPTIKETLEAQKAKSLLHKPDKSGQLEMLWKEAYSERYKTYCPSFTQKQRGQLKMFAEKCPSGKAEQIIRAIVGDWVPFAHAVESAAGLKSSPDLPNLDFMLRHVQTAVSVALPKPKQQEAAKVFVPLPNVQSIALIESEEPKMTQAELLAFINSPEPK